MSGPMSTNEIEDVVSSVRRLVSTDQRPRAVSRDLGGDKLILTPALRVVADNAAANAPASPSGPAVLILTGENLAVDPLETDIEMMPGVGDNDRLHLVDAEWEDEIWSAPEAPLAELALGAEEAEVVAVLADPVLADPVAASLWPEASEDEAPWIEAAPGTEWAEEPQTAILAFPVPEPMAEPALVVADTIAETSAASHDEALVEVTSVADAGGQDAAENEIDVAEVLSAALIEDEGFRVLEEAELHDLVRAMVREELQGSLGERITRNVRKLVRAEVNRALAARALD
jgi:hypothetical protein